MVLLCCSVAGVVSPPFFFCIVMHCSPVASFIGLTLSNLVAFFFNVGTFSGGVGVAVLYGGGGHSSSYASSRSISVSSVSYNIVASFPHVIHDSMHDPDSWYDHILENSQTFDLSAIPSYSYSWAIPSWLFAPVFKFSVWLSSGTCCSSLSVARTCSARLVG